MINTTLQIAGAALLAFGAGMIFIPAGFIVAGGFTLAIGIARGLK